MFRLLPLAVLTFLTSGCFGPQLLDSQGHTMVESPGVYTLVNLHPDAAMHGNLYSINYQRDALLPLCTQVEILEMKSDVMRFKLVETGAEYNFYQHNRTPEPFAYIVRQYFGRQCNKPAVAQLSNADQEGIRTGKPRRGMTKQGVIFAMGYPPSHATPSPEQDRWIYWTNRFAKRIVQFSREGKVIHVGR